MNPLRIEEYVQGNVEQNKIIFYQRIQAFAAHLTKLLNKLDNLTEDELASVSILYKRYFETFVEDYQSYNEIYTADGVRGTKAMHLFVELSRAHFILQYARLKKERAILLESQKENPSFLVTYSLKTCKSDFWQQNDNEKSILDYNQEEIMDMLLMLTKRANEMPFEKDCVQDFEMLVLAVFTRNSIFFCQSCSIESLNLDNMRSKLPVSYCPTGYVPNRDYMIFVTIYFNALQRRLYYYSQMSRNIQQVAVEPELTKKCEDWVRKTVVKNMGSEGFEDTYMATCEECFRFSGDKEWFGYRYPGRPLTLGPLLDCIRPAEAKAYFIAYKVTLEPVLDAAVGRNDHQGYRSRQFVLNAIDQYIRAQYNTPWLDAVMIVNESIERSSDKLCKTLCPCLLQVLSDFWVYSGGKIYPTSNIYETIVTWFKVLKEEYRCRLFRVDLSPLVNLILFKKVEQDEVKYEIWT